MTSAGKSLSTEKVAHMTDMDMRRLCARAMGLEVRIRRAQANTFLEYRSHYLTNTWLDYDPITDFHQAWMLADKFPLIAADVFSAVAIARHDGETDPRMVDPRRLLVECIAAKHRVPPDTGAGER